MNGNWRLLNSSFNTVVDHLFEVLPQCSNRSNPFIGEAFHKQPLFSSKQKNRMPAASLLFVNRLLFQQNEHTHPVLLFSSHKACVRVTNILTLPRRIAVLWLMKAFESCCQPSVKTSRGFEQL